MPGNTAGFSCEIWLSHAGRLIQNGVVNDFLANLVIKKETIGLKDENSIINAIYRPGFEIYIKKKKCVTQLKVCCVFYSV